MSDFFSVSPSSLLPLLCWLFQFFFSSHETFDGLELFESSTRITARKEKVICQTLTYEISNRNKFSRVKKSLLFQNCFEVHLRFRRLIGDMISFIVGYVILQYFLISFDKITALLMISQVFIVILQQRHLPHATLWLRNAFIIYKSEKIREKWAEN